MVRSVARFLLCIAFVLSATAVVPAEVIELEGVIKSLDADKREITIGKKTLDVAKKCRVTVDGADASLADLKQDQEVIVEYDDELDVAKTITVGSSTLDGDAVARVLKDLQGEWLAVEGEVGTDGKVDKNLIRRENRRITINGNSWSAERVIGGNIGTYKGKFEINPKTKAFDWIGKGPGGKAVEWIGIYELSGDTLKVCYRYNNDETAKRPKEFTTADSKSPNLTVFYTLKRQE